MDKFINSLKGKSIHIVGVTGSEGSGILSFLLKHNLSNITAHDFLTEKTLEKSFKLWHKGLPAGQRENLYRNFLSDLGRVDFRTGSEYLNGIKGADIIFVPQSWRLYKKENRKLFEAHDKKIPFYSITRLYLDLAPATIIAVTGTVGKGSVSSLIVQMLNSVNRKVYFAGNETWMVQLAGQIDAMNQSDVLVLEVSHRQLQDGFSKPPHVAVITNLYPNHLDEVSWENYKSLKLSLVYSQNSSDFSILNYDNLLLREIAGYLKSKVILFSEKLREMNTKDIQKEYDLIMNNKIAHYNENILAALSAVNSLGIDIGPIVKNLSDLITLPARLELIAEKNGIKIYDDIKSTTPWATAAAVKKLAPGVILICGGRTKGIDYNSLAEQLRSDVKFTIILRSELSSKLAPLLSENQYCLSGDLDEALKIAGRKAVKGDSILVSPGAGFFYSDFIKGKISLRKMVISLLPGGKV